ncbi:MAG: DUF4390 domain-containing protein [Zoogloeaceae bacterium]|jgi:hypothetical protein|nr:DUF4390 domain-containing protein [Zoogloeaceae bacterium]
MPDRLLPEPFRPALQGLRSCIPLFLALLAVILCGVVKAEGIEILNPKIEAGSEGSHVLSADTEIHFNSRLEELVEKGIPLFFRLEFVLERPRWYWSDQTVAQTSQTRQLSYHALTRQYRLTTGSLHQTFPDLASALRALARIHRWQIMDQPPEPGETLNASLRLRLDTAQLPKLFQVGSARNEWGLNSGWHAWKYTVPALSAAPKPDGEGDNDVSGTPAP